MHDLLIRGGTIVDGTGAPPRTGDVAIDGDRIVAVGRAEGPARRTIEADGLIVAPGFVDIHTHYDGQATWDPWLDPSFSSGVTTALMGNCGVGFAPVRPDDREKLIALMEGVEEIPGTALHEGLSWNWTSFTDYLDTLAAVPHSFDVGAIVPHGPLRLFAMGDKVGTDKCASGEELTVMTGMLDAALAAGAFGMSSSRTPVHRTIHGEMTPDYNVDEAEFGALAQTVARHGGFIEVAPLGLVGEDFDGAKAEIAMYDRIIAKTDVDLHMQIIQTNQYPDYVFDQLAWAESINARGRSRVFGQTGGRGLGTLLSFYGINPFMDRPSFVEIARLPRKERLAVFAKPEVRARILAERSVPGDFPAFMVENLAYCYDLGAAMDYEPGPERRLTVAAERRGLGLSETVYDLMLESSDAPRLLLPFSNYARGSFDDLAKMLDSPAALVCLSDAGAHVMTVCDGAIYPFMVAHWARDRKRGPLMPVERVVKMVTGDCAKAVGLHDRGVLAPGLKADVNVFDFDRIGACRPTIFDDLPAGAERLMQIGHGFRATIASGVVTRENDERTGALPGKLVRRGR